MVVNTCQYSPSLTMWTLWLSSHTSGRSPVAMEPGAQRPIQDPTWSNQAPHCETRLHDLEQIRFRNLRHPATLQHGQRQQQLLYWSTPRWEIHLAWKYDTNSSVTYDLWPVLWIPTASYGIFLIFGYFSGTWAIGNPFLGTSLAPEAFWPEGLHGDTRPATNHTCKAELNFSDLTCFRCNTGQYQAQHIVLTSWEGCCKSTFSEQCVWRRYLAATLWSPGTS